MQNAFKHQAHMLKSRVQHDMMKLHAKPSKFHIEQARNGATHAHKASLKDKLPKTTTRHMANIKTSYKNKVGTNMICTSSTDYILQIPLRFKYIGITITPM